MKRTLCRQMILVTLDLNYKAFESMNLNYRESVWFSAEDMWHESFRGNIFLQVQIHFRCSKLCSRTGKENYQLLNKQTIREKKNRKNLALRRILSLRLKAKKKKKRNSPLTSCVVGLPFESVTSRLPTALFSSTSRLRRVLYAVVTAVSFSCCLVMDDKGVWNEKKVSHTEGHDTRRPNKQKKDSWKTNRWNEE